MPRIITYTGDSKVKTRATRLVWLQSDSSFAGLYHAITRLQIGSKLDLLAWTSRRCKPSRRGGLPPSHSWSVYIDLISFVPAFQPYPNPTQPNLAFAITEDAFRFLSDPGMLVYRPCHFTRKRDDDWKKHATCLGEEWLTEPWISQLQRASSRR
ncbi:uncharacterized protein MYCFIDRAFT_177590 [Pseudocercospora fijiensis CIRAD86]|uniref:Uncharacterized protein n=1 Tax=Pseudocercospora fijiensis (strain CIRAD86) TaxID=383855 RepID=M2YSG6_PSEFD|nr:uncharacterized protein MYCFIDRAFT_177590 [Pseudocercospora fijiensis CIRAD86]EME80660.1 hypothetical protein MYCFIDRAFT_177590 [Pseudocercospora fijiensis CIRAD86]